MVLISSQSKLKVLMTMLAMILFNLAAHALSEDKLVVVQAVSTSKRSFAIRQGAADGLTLGQESLFSSRSMNFKARLIEMNRHHSVWKVSDERGQVPFSKEDIVTYTNSLENLWSYLPTLFKSPKEHFSVTKSWLIRGSYSYGLKESTSDVEASSVNTRIGLNFQGSYAKRFKAQWEWLAGLRYDRDVATLGNTGLNATTTRYLGMAEVLYYFDKSPFEKYHFYAGVGAGYGISNTSLSDEVATGTALVLPNVKVGFRHKVGVSYSMIAEFSVEGISQSESFLEEEAQTTQIINTGISLGLRF
jgi:hypothetical protein